ncbi:MAG TPA: hypothetical protein VGY53_02170, partial [Isosphaeraceae bacterium]|nr:hypothetical protein [Isosphaeraceae bacterium]
MSRTRRAFLEAAGAGLSFGLAGLAQAQAPGGFPYAQGAPPAPKSAARPKLAALATTYHYLSHAYHIVGRFLDGFIVHDGKGFHRPNFEIASLFIEQTPAGDLGRAKAKRHG